jgi:hypothetical protein
MANATIDPNDPSVSVALSPRQLAAILAALRYYQNDLDGSALSSDVDAAGELNEIATDGGSFTGLDSSEVDGLCEELNHPSAHAEQAKAVAKALRGEPLTTAEAKHALGGIDALVAGRN